MHAECLLKTWLPHRQIFLPGDSPSLHKNDIGINCISMSFFIHRKVRHLIQLTHQDRGNGYQCTVRHFSAYIYVLCQGAFSAQTQSETGLLSQLPRKKYIDISTRPRHQETGYSTKMPSMLSNSGSASCIHTIRNRHMAISSMTIGGTL